MALELLYKETVIFVKLLRESVSFAFSQLWGDKFRTFLSLVGVGVGIFTIVAIFTAIDALQENDSVTGVSPIVEGGKTIGYTITFVKNDAIKRMKVFQNCKLPDTIDEFVALFDRGNRLRTKYLMALESSVQDDVHATLEDGGKYYEIRILNREISYRNGDSDARETFDIVLVEDVTKQLNTMTTTENSYKTCLKTQSY